MKEVQQQLLKIGLGKQREVNNNEEVGKRG
jgi:hypothetical protein